ncbi:MAG TPA: glycerol-3-phosphate 1-O-acyltransferase PlsY [Miltoncostaeales bacterium]|nr:glycerol-3-phosphate 1-O-acyltransferase PlsY [Miltoncostaeales bacterium]
MNVVIAIAAGYLLGSIPFGYLIGRWRGVDLRSVGSGNTGAANAFRNLGRRWGLAVAGLDIAKGVAGALIGRALTDDSWPIAAGAAVMVGAIFPVWLRFRGGKGVAAGGGVLIGLFPIASAILVPVWIAIVLLTRITSLAAILASIAFVPLAWLLGYPWPYLLLAAAMAALVIYRHRANIARLRDGTEAKLEFRRNGSANV